MRRVKKNLHITLSPEIYELKEVIVNAKESPAYRIIREAIKKRKKHLTEIKNYSCQVYTKGSVTLIPPDKLFWIKISDSVKKELNEGSYLSETVSELFFTYPDQYRVNIISSKVSGSKELSINLPHTVNFYNNTVWEGLERGFVSPISQNAFLYYDYEYMGSFTQQKDLIHRIKVIRKGKYTPTFSGYISIVDGEWSIQNVDFLLTQQSGIKILDSVKINQTYTQSSGVWIPISSNLFLKITIDLLGTEIKARGYFLNNYSQYKITLHNGETNRDTFQIPSKTIQKDTFRASQELQSLNQDLQDTTKKNMFQLYKIARKIKKIQKKQEKLPQRKNELVTYQPDATEKDSLYWVQIRPIPLTEQEIKNYKKKDSIFIITQTPKYKDSVEKKNKKITWDKILVTGYNYFHPHRKYSLKSPPLFLIFGYNTVEGFVGNFDFLYTKEFENKNTISITPTLRYGFSSKQWYGKISSQYSFGKYNGSSVTLSTGQFVQQFNAKEPIIPLINTLETLLRECNLMKLYEKIFVKTTYKTEIINGLSLELSTDWEQRKSIQNTSSISFIDYKNRAFTSNTPYYIDTSAYKNMPIHNALFSSLTISYKPANKYIIRNGKKENSGSRYPLVSFTYKKGIKNIFSSAVDFDFISFSFLQNVNYKLGGKGKVYVEYGEFLNRNLLFFPDLFHFNGNRSLFSSFLVQNYQLLDYYTYSTDTYYFQMHYEHHFNGFITNIIPLVKKTNVQLTTSVHYLYTPLLKNYMEFGIGLEQIFTFIRVDYLFNYHEKKIQQHGVRIGLVF